MRPAGLLGSVSRRQAPAVTGIRQIIASGRDRGSVNRFPRLLRKRRPGPDGLLVGGWNGMSLATGWHEANIATPTSAHGIRCSLLARASTLSQARVGTAMFTGSD